MKLAVAVVLLAAACQAVVTAVGKTTKGGDKTDKRELSEGNAGVGKRAPALQTASSALSGGVEYADTSNALPDQSPSRNNENPHTRTCACQHGRVGAANCKQRMERQIYSTPVPQFSKISDLLTAQTPSYQAAIANHLYSPVSIYQPRFGQPTTYEVSAPVSSNLAYSEHRLSLPSPNAIQYNAKPEKVVKPNFVQPQVLIQPSFEQHFPQHGTASPLNQQYSQLPQQLYNNQLHYLQPNQQQINTFTQQQINQVKSHQQPEQRDLKNQPAPSQVLEKQVIQQVYNDKPQAALSYAKFSVSQLPPSPSLQQVHQQPLPQAQFQAQQVIQPQQYQAQQQVPLQQYQQTQPQQYLQPQPLQISYQLQHPAQQLTQAPQVQLQGQPQQVAQPLQTQLRFQQEQPHVQYQEQPQYLYQQLQEQAFQQQGFPQQIDQYQQQGSLFPQQYQNDQYQNIQSQQYQQPQLFNVEKSELSTQSIPDRQSYFKHAPIIQPKLNFNQPQVQSSAHQTLPASPTFPPVQYFGKFAQSLFGDSQH